MSSVPETEITAIIRLIESIQFEKAHPCAREVERFDTAIADLLQARDSVRIALAERQLQDALERVENGTSTKADADLIRQWLF